MIPEIIRESLRGGKEILNFIENSRGESSHVFIGNTPRCTINPEEFLKKLEDMIECPAEPGFYTYRSLDGDLIYNFQIIL